MPRRIAPARSRFFPSSAFPTTAPTADIWSCYKKWGGKGAFFLTEPLANPDGWEWRRYMRDPDGYIIEVGQYTQVAIDWFHSHS